MKITTQERIQKRLGELKKMHKEAVRTPYGFSDGLMVEANCLNFGSISCSENTMLYIEQAANRLPELIASYEELLKHMPNCYCGTHILVPTNCNSCLKIEKAADLLEGK